MISLVGYTGFVGSNILQAAGSRIDGLFNSKNIRDAFGLAPDLLIYAGLRAEKFLANKNPEADARLIEQAQKNIRLINPRNLVFISTVDVIADTAGTTEKFPTSHNGLTAYGSNRLNCENWVRKHYPEALIIRLPALFGTGLKKNFVFDCMNIVPTMLNEQRLNDLRQLAPDVASLYEPSQTGFHVVKQLDRHQRRLAADKCAAIGLTALDFTDCRSTYQFYPLHRLWSDINTALEHDIKLWHPATEPVSAAEVYCTIRDAGGLGADGLPARFSNILQAPPAHYDFHTIWSSVFGGQGDYILTRQEVLSDLASFAESEVV